MSKKKLIDGLRLVGQAIQVETLDGQGIPYDLMAVPLEAIDDAPIIDAMEIPANGIGELSDGYHTFNELYHHRAVMFSVICNMHASISWKSKKHHDGTMYDGMFIVGINTSEGQVTYHYDIEPYWDMFKVPEVELAPEWDGHTSDEAIHRIGSLDVVESVAWREKKELENILKAVVNHHSDWECYYCKQSLICPSCRCDNREFYELDLEKIKESYRIVD